jgi:DNA-binding IscR family transcriptional regulator
VVALVELARQKNGQWLSLKALARAKGLRYAVLTKQLPALVRAGLAGTRRTT